MATHPKTTLPSRKVPRPDELRPLTRDPLTTVEVRELWSFLHGDIMSVPTREALQDSWGLCDRHAWGHAVVEIELWEAPLGDGVAHQPFDAVVLLAGILEHALTTLPHRKGRRLSRALEGTGECPICRSTSPEATLSAGYAGMNAAALTRDVADLHHTTDWVRATETSWRPKVCPRCSGTGQGPLCRSHWAQAADDERTDADVLSALDSWRCGLARYQASLNQAGNPCTPSDRATWICALAWFHGWSVPLDLLNSQP